MCSLYIAHIKGGPKEGGPKGWGLNLNIGQHEGLSMERTGSKPQSNPLLPTTPGLEEGFQGMGVASNNWFDRVLSSILYMSKPLILTADHQAQLGGTTHQTPEGTTWGSGYRCSLDSLE